MNSAGDTRSRDPAEDGMPPRLVLIVEDERSIASVVAEVVADAGHLPSVARHGRDALKLALEQWPALVITDLMVPHLDGAGLIAALRAEVTEERGMPPVILMTAAGMHYASAAGADAILHKPFDLSELEALLSRFLG
ncbi:MAG TPA: response regulator [Chloroflexota bacterium]|nr:response regulator [Chloroflexota bacterium]